MFTKKLFIPLMLVFMVTQTGCISFIEELFLKKDGTGQYKITIDMSAMMDEEMMKSMAESFFKDIAPTEGEKVEKTAEENEAATETKEPPVEMDSIVYFKDAPLKWKKKFKDNPGFLDKVHLHMVTSESQRKLFMSWVLNFDNFDEVDYFCNNFDKLMDEGGKKEKKEMEFLDFGEQPDVENLFSLSKGKLTRIKAPLNTEKISEEDKSMMQMMFGEANFRSILHLPGKVQKASNPEAKISEDGKTVTTEIPFLDYIEGKKNMANVVKFE